MSVKVFSFLLSLVCLFSICDGLVDIIDNGVVNDPDIECAADAINVHFNTKNPFDGKVYIKGHVDEQGCRIGPEDGSKNSSNNMKAFGITVPFARCGVSRKRSINPVGIAVSTVVVITFHPLFLTKIDRAYEIRCFYMAADKTVSVDLGVSDLTEDTINGGLVTGNVPMPVCRYEVLDGPSGKPVKFANIGDSVYHKWTCDTTTTDIFCVLIHSCFVDDGRGSNRALLLDENGCALDRYLLQNLDYPTDLQAGREAQVFKYADRPQLFFQCQISILLKDGATCSRPKCTNPEKGRRKRDLDMDDTIATAPTVDVASDPINIFEIDDSVETSNRLNSPNWRSVSRNQHSRVAYQSRVHKPDDQHFYSARPLNSRDDQNVCMTSASFTAIVITTVLVCLVTIIVSIAVLRRKRRKMPVFYPPPPHSEEMYGYTTAA